MTLVGHYNWPTCFYSSRSDEEIEVCTLWCLGLLQLWCLALLQLWCLALLQLWCLTLLLLFYFYSRTETQLVLIFLPLPLQLKLHYSCFSLRLESPSSTSPSLLLDHPCSGLVRSSNRKPSVYGVGKLSILILPLLCTPLQ